MPNYPPLATHQRFNVGLGFWLSDPIFIKAKKLSLPLMPSSDSKPLSQESTASKKF
ncbi:hypothetical protein AVDCRST_MAG92-798 [uncultured Coleofasciculus sp.]|uniref:Uncharacterized protein n=1 Tax=uncultured Coleofasciculus sp. TaxID=1267456 RepID=A0A6J4HKW1_9CYAN|nr:hypothetical protein AVDCRST_MAG92-798 [uncultured Coleofasciculus sp.]